MCLTFGNEFEPKLVKLLEGCFWTKTYNYIYLQNMFALIWFLNNITVPIGN